MEGIQPTYNMAQGDGYGFGGSGIWLFAILALFLFGNRGNSATTEDLATQSNFSRLENQLGNIGATVEEMHNEDGTIGGHWTVEQTEQVAMQYGISFDKFNKYDWNYVMNMIYSDYYGAIGNNTESYVKVAKKFIMDKDAPEGKALKYYIAMKD